MFTTVSEMTPFQQLRLWFRRAPFGERLAAAGAIALVLSVLGFVVVPAASHHNPNKSNVNAGAGPAGVGAGGAGGTSTGSTALSGAGASAGGSSGAGAGGINGAGSGVNAGPAASAGGIGSEGLIGVLGGCPPGSDQGVDGSQIKIAAILVNVAGAATNSIAGYPNPSEQQLDYQQVVDEVNASGGIACHKVAIQFYTPNIADQSSLQQTCLDVQQAGVFSVIDSGAYLIFPSLATCYPQHQIPLWGGGYLPAKLKDQYYPYYFGQTVEEVLYHNTIVALSQRGYFSPGNGFNKLGLIYRDCDPEYIPEVQGWLSEVGVSSSKVVPFNFGCSSALFASPSVIEGAILKFKQAGVTHVTIINDINDFGNFTTIAEQQAFRPKYGIPDDGQVAASSGAGAYNYQNMNNAIAITQGRWGEQTTPGMTPTAATMKCDAIYAARGRPPTYRQPDGAGGTACNYLWMLKAAIEHAPVLQRNALASGLQAARSVDFSYPFGPNDFTGPRVTTGGQFWRPLQFLTSCTCWRVLDATFRFSF